MRQIIIIGGGPAGVEAALAAATAVSQVTLISDAPIGGRAGWHSLLPSKLWLTVADTLGLLATADEFGLQAGAGRPDVTAVLARLEQVKQAWSRRQHGALTARGVQLLTGVAACSGPQSVTVRNPDGTPQAELTADAVIVAAGSVPWFPPGLRPDGQRVIAPRFAGGLTALPDSMLVIGAGATGCEFAYLFNRLGVDVTWIVDQLGVLPQMHPDLGRLLGQALVRQGVRMVAGQMVDRLERDGAGVTAVLQDGARYQAEMAFVAIGRLPDWERLNLDAAGLQPQQGVIEVDEYGRTANPRVYLVGDAVGGWMVANKAMAQARIAGRHAAGLPTPPYRRDGLVLAAYTQPQAAQVGCVVPHPDVRTVRVPYSAALKSYLEPESAGFIELSYAAADRRLLGAVALGAHAADVLSPVALAINLGATLDDLANTYAAHPVVSELAFIAARAAPPGEG
jgi:pyruvate/2-oxoglutarate dehydrogenase complex dihydrolipoamide dehydrogenase (E3) component